MYNSSDEDEETEPIVKPNAFDVLMAPSSKNANKDDVDPVCTAVVYDRHLVHIPDSEPLYGLHYYGQAVRAVGTVHGIANDRWRSETYEAMREHKQIGLLACLELFGADAFENRVVAWKIGPRSVVQKWADEQEMRLIEEGGGVLRNSFKSLKQTLNLTAGGKPTSVKGRAHIHTHFAAIDALRTVAWERFRSELDVHVKATGSASCLVSTVTSSGYRLGNAVQSVRKGHLWKGHPDSENRVMWLESLPKWQWNDSLNARRSDWLKFQSEMVQYIETELTSLVPQAYQSPGGYNLGTAVANVRQGQMLTNHPDKDERIRWLESLPDWVWNAQSTESFRQQHREIAQLQFQHEKAEGKPTIVDHGKRTRTDQWTPEMFRATREKTAATNAVKRAAVLAALPESERPKKQAEFDRNDLKEANRKSKANALLKLPSYAEKGYQWCYKNLTQATNDGVVFSQDSNGVWCARGRGNVESLSA